MPAIEERVAYVEGRLQEQAAQMHEIRTLTAELRQDMRDLRNDMDRRFDTMEHRFAWLVGLTITGFLAVIGTVAGGFWSVLETIQPN